MIFSMNVTLLNVLFDKLQLLLGNGMVYHSVVGIIILVLTLIAGKIFKLFLNTIGRKIITATESDLDDKILEIVLARTIAVFGLTGMYLGIRELRSGATVANTSIHNVLDFSNHLLFILTILVVTSVVVKIAHTVATHLIKSKTESEHVHQTLTPLINRVATFLIATIAIIVVLDHFGQNFSTVLTLLGAGSLALGLAAQDTISNMISGFVIMIDQPFRVGDRVKLPSGEEGDVFEVGLRSTKILDLDHNLLIIPNNDLVKTRVVNFSYPSDEIRVVLDVNVAYGAQVEQVKTLLLRIATAHTKVLKEPAPQVILINLGDWNLHFRLTCRIDSYKQKALVTEELRISVYEEFAKAGIEIPLPQSVVHYTKELPG